jgi:hypothetical protein
MQCNRDVRLQVWARGFMHAFIRFVLSRKMMRRRPLVNWSGRRCNAVTVVVVLAEDPVEEHGQPHSPLRDPPRHDREPRVEVVVCK